MACSVGLEPATKKSASRTIVLQQCQINKVEQSYCLTLRVKTDEYSVKKRQASAGRVKVSNGAGQGAGLALFILKL